MDGGADAWSGPRLIEDGEWAGWRAWHGLDPFEDQSGPFYFKDDDQGRVTAAFRAEKKHMNGGGFMHGGCLMTFADFALFMIGASLGEEVNGVTVSMNSEFLAAAHQGQLLLARGERTGGGKTLVFARGTITADGVPVLAFSGVMKVFHAR